MSVKKIVKRVLFYTSVFLSAILSVALIRTLTVVPIAARTNVCKESDADFIRDADGMPLSRRLSNALAFQTVSWTTNNTNLKEVWRFIEFIEKSFPAVHSASFVHQEVINNGSLLYTVKGLDPSLKPYMLAGHLDVVPVDITQWNVPPFEGTIRDGFVYGRGAIDAKHIVMGIMEAFEAAIKNGYRPRRSFLIAFGHDEEVSGNNGAAHIAALLRSRNVDLEYILDEGLLPTVDCYPGIKAPVVSIGVTEKGYLSVNLTVKGVTGHSSMPPGDSAIVKLSKLLTKFHYKAHPNMFGKGLEHETFTKLAPYMPFVYRFVYSNLWLFSPLLAWVMTFKPPSHSIVRTTTAVTIVTGGLKDNVLPTFASAVINHRVHPSQTIDEVLEFDRQLIDIEDAKLEVVTSSDPAPFSPYDSESFGYQMLVTTANQIYPNSPVIPDTRWYFPFSKAIYRFSPASLHCDDTKGFHGNNERIPVESYEKLVNFYYHLMKNSDARGLQKQRGRDEL